MNVKQQVPITNIEQLMKSYPTSFDTLGQFKGDYHIVLKPDSQPVVHATRKCPIQMHNEIKQTLYDIKNNGIIRKVTEPTPWYLVSHTHARVMVNYVYALTQTILTKTLWALTTKLPPLKKLHGSTLFSNGYWSTTLDKDSQLLTTFNTPVARYCFIRMPFGLVMSQDVFQQRMEIILILEQCPGTIGIADDVVVYGQNESEHDANLHRLMQVAVKEGLLFNI